MFSVATIADSTVVVAERQKVIGAIKIQMKTEIETEMNIKTTITAMMRVSKTVKG